MNRCLARTSCLAWLAAVLVMAAGLPAAEPAAERYVIIHADDAGMSHSANRATIEAMETGTVSSASIMVPCPWFPEIARYAAAHPERDMGIHLTLNCEWKNYRWGPVAPRAEVPSLVDEDGYLWSSVRQVVAHAKAEEVERELRAQIDRARKFGVPITHLDLHMGAAVSRPDLARIYVKLGQQYDISFLFVHAKPDSDIAKQFPGVIELAATLEKSGAPVLDTIVQLYNKGPLEQRKARYVEALRNLPPGVSQIIIHCGYDDEELRAITASASIRDGDRRIFTDPEVIAEIEKENIKVITWKEFREMQTGKGSK